MKLTDNQRSILTLLSDRSESGIGSFVSPTHIGHVLHPSRKHGSPWASPRCIVLRNLGLLERNHRGHYRITESGRKIVEEAKI